MRFEKTEGKFRINCRITELPTLRFMIYKYLLTHPGDKYAIELAMEVNKLIKTKGLS